MLAARFGVMCAEKLMTQILEYSNVAGLLIRWGQFTSPKGHRGFRVRVRDRDRVRVMVRVRVSACLIA